MADGILGMSLGERERAFVVRQIVERLVSQRVGAERLCISLRQVKRLVRAYRATGDGGLVSRQRGRVSPRKMAPDIALQVEGLLRDKYAGFGPTLAAEKLAELDAIKISRESVRSLQIAFGLWQPKSRRAKRVHRPRQRRPRFGELVQIDGSPHDWLEGRGPKCTLIVFIDDATSRLTALQFSLAETTAAYLAALKTHVLARGLPLAFYSDKHGIFRVNAKDAVSGDGKTEFGRVVDRLKIELINASTPQAKGRVERANQTLQDRLIKEMRLAGVCTLAEAQAFAPLFMAKWNRRFAKPPLAEEDAHRPWTGTSEALDEVLARREERTLSKALTFSSGAMMYCVKTAGPGIALRGARVTLYHFANGSMQVHYKNRILPCTPFRTLAVPTPLEDDKTIGARMDALIATIAIQPRARTLIPQVCG